MKLKPLCSIAIASGLASLAALIGHPVRAEIVYTFSQVGPDVRMTATGSLNTLPAFSLTTGLSSPTLRPMIANIITSPTLNSGAYSYKAFQLPSGPTNFGGLLTATPSSVDPLSMISLLETGGIPGIPGAYWLPDTYQAGDPFFASMTFGGTTIESLALTPGTYAWALPGTNESIQVVIPSAPVPGPLPLLGVGSALAWSRRLRRRQRWT
jgi:hypothetical protein